MNEVWKDIPGFENFYQVSNFGRIRSLKHWNGIRNCYDNRIKIMNPTRCKTNQYYSVRLKGKNYQLHRLIALTFLKNPNNYSVVNHIDGNKINNMVKNLEWCTHKHNTQEAQRIGLYDDRNKKMSLNPIRSKTIEMYDVGGNYIRSFSNSVEAEMILKNRFKGIKVNARNIRNVCNGKRKTAGGYVWRYKD